MKKIHAFTAMLIMGFGILVGFVYINEPASDDHYRQNYYQDCLASDLNHDRLLCAKKSYQMFPTEATMKSNIRQPGNWEHYRTTGLM